MRGLKKIFCTKGKQKHKKPGGNIVISAKVDFKT